MRENLKWIISAIALILVGCASMEYKIDRLPPGAAMGEVDQVLKESRYTVVEKKVGPEGAIEVRRYSSYSREWDLTFKDGKLVGWKRSPGDSDYKMGYKETEYVGYPCEDPLLGMARFGIFFSCDD